MEILEPIFYLIAACGCFYISYLSFKNIIDMNIFGRPPSKYQSHIYYKGFSFKRTFGNGYICIGEIPIEIKAEAAIKFNIEIIK